ncbi:T6SS phospholipase effector Tle1-like catalytic domain-containing protein [Saccharicrinis aurantiacus]|uniref:T6SS phospholipase effector Tle1-like catalytic domain-containing protein n=1 Tax=Saccharicrinis aurantiacus TaxID=1849719 RepID=UPI0024928581|nr:DUF2235 domain-containing protein [Saccharicrinis aurantiacus]
MKSDSNHGYIEARAEYNSSADGINSNKVRILDNSDEVEVRVSMFFDGTGNNMYNIDAHKENDKRIKGDEYDSSKAWAGRLNVIFNDSFKSEYSNVARLFTNYEKKESSAQIVTAEYVEGIGTKKHLPDRYVSQGIGSYTRGITDKVTDGCNQVADKINNLIGFSIIKSLTFDVFGFSRGAAAARQFIYEINKPAITKMVQTGPRSFHEVATPARGDLGKAFEEKGIVYNGEIKVQFAGLFDTVPSYKGMSKIVMDEVTKAQDVLHLTALDERRANFSLVNIASKGLQYEKELPGVHSDVGGGYLPEEEEDKKVFYQTRLRSAEKEIEYLLEDSWYKDRSCLRIDKSSMGTYLIGKKLVNYHYSFIPLQIMRKKAVEEPNEIKFMVDLKTKYAPPEDLEVTHKRLEDYVFKKGIQPMRYHPVQELISEIKSKFSSNEIDTLLDKMHSRSGTPDSGYKNYIRGMVPQKWSTIIERAFNQFMNENLHEDDFEQHPDLQQKIKDRNQLKNLRLNYFHTSHLCKPTDEVYDYFNPYKTSVRDAPSREIINDYEYRK